MKKTIPAKPIYKRGQIYWIDFDPSAGHEIQKHRPALILSDVRFSMICPGQAFVAPITSGGDFARIRGLTVELTKDTKTTGVVRLDQARTLDMIARNAKYIEDAPDEVVKRALSLFNPFVT